MECDRAAVGPALVSVVLLLSACSAALTADSGAATQSADVSLSASDQRILDELHTHSSAWNRTVTPVVDAYLDPTVDAAAWLDQVDDALPELMSTASAIQALTSVVADDTLRRHLEAISDNYDEKLSAMQRLRVAVADSNSDEEKAAADAVASAGETGRQLAANLLGTLRDVFGMDPTGLLDALQEAQENLDTARAGEGGAPSSARSSNNYVAVEDATGSLYVEVPSPWADVNTRPFEDYPALLASTNIDAMLANNAPGVLFTVVAGGQDHSAMIDDFGPEDACARSERVPYDDGMYAGVIQYGDDCGTGLVSDSVVIVASPPADDMTLVVVMQILNGVHDETVAHIADTFQVLHE